MFTGSSEERKKNLSVNSMASPKLSNTSQASKLHSIPQKQHRSTAQTPPLEFPASHSRPSEKGDSPSRYRTADLHYRWRFITEVQLVLTMGAGNIQVSPRSGSSLSMYGTFSKGARSLLPWWSFASLLWRIRGFFSFSLVCLSWIFFCKKGMDM